MEPRKHHIYSNGLHPGTSLIELNKLKAIRKVLVRASYPLQSRKVFTESVSDVHGIRDCIAIRFK